MKRVSEYQLSEPIKGIVHQNMKTLSFTHPIEGVAAMTKIMAVNLTNNLNVLHIKITYVNNQVTIFEYFQS